MNCLVQYSIIFDVFDSIQGKFDELVEEKGVRILVEARALMHVIGSKMDFMGNNLRYGPFCVRVLILSSLQSY
ncbi:unnamed protein product [Arabis nemorensis]|uniref:Uncharacterized protein n=1 Tax=Arabis nemorensis TaxID=586526 RepID=A0A565BLX7_9BRAS|nr:unnamed protein product [Arabis nemorensis]